MKQASCNTALSESTCETNCGKTDSVFQGDCGTKQLDEFACVTDLTCEELASYADDKLASPMCGATYQAFASACTLNQGVPPKECVDFCEKSLTCTPGGRKVAGCAQTCNEVLTGYNIAGGMDCSGVMQEAFGCLATVDCPSLTTTLGGGPTPAACAQYDTQLTAACR